MTHIPDPMFRNGLEHYRRPAPASVWERVESGLDRKRRKSVWLKVAAGLFLLIATLTVFWQYDPTDTYVATEESKDSVRESSDVSREVKEMGNSQHSQVNSIVERSRNNPSDVVHEDLPVVDRSRNEPSRSSRQSSFSRESSDVSREVVNSPNESQLISLVETDELLETPVFDIQIENSMKESVNDAGAEQKRTSITYTSKEVNEKFLKKEVTAQATPEKKNASGLQKVIDKALDLKNDESVLAELREKKNELLSINYPSRKRDTNK